MDKIKIEIQYHTLDLICLMYIAVTEYHSNHPVEIQFTREYKAIKDIVDRLMVKLQKKSVDKKTASKPFNLSLEYNQAFYLKHFLNANYTFIHGVFEQNLLLQFQNKLDIQL